MTDLTREQVLERVRKRREKKAIKEAVKDVKFPVDIQPATGMDVFNDVTGGIQSMANPALRLLSRAEEGLGGGGYFRGILENQQASQDRGARLRADWPGPLGSGGADVGDIAGELTGGIALTKGQGVAPTVMGRFAQGGATGAAIAPAFAPLEEDTTSAMNTGAKYGLLMTPAFEGIRFGAEKFGPSLGKLFSSTKDKTARILKDILGDQKTAVRNALQNTKSRVPGEKLTAGEAAAPARSPQMSVIQKMADDELPKHYDAINEANKAARLKAIKSAGGNIKELKAERTAATTPLRERALSLADESGGLNTEGIVQNIDDVLSDKMIPTIQRKALMAVKQNILSRANKDTGAIEADALYTVRKEIGNTLESTFSKEGVRWDKAMAGRAQTKIQSIIDDAIENAGGEGWRNYLRTYREKSIPIDNAKLANTYAEKLVNPLGKETPVSFAGASKRNPPNNQKLQVERDAVMESLERRNTVAELAKKGVENTKASVREAKLPNTGMFSPAYQVTKSIINAQFSNRNTKKILRELAEAFDDPQKVLELLAKTDMPGPVQRTIHALSQQQAAATVGALGAKYSVHPH